MPVPEAGKTIGQRSRYLAEQRVSQPPRSYPRPLQVPSDGSLHAARNNTARSEARTIGERARSRTWISFQPEPASPPIPSQEPQPQNSGGKHRAEYIRSQGAEPLSVADIKNRLAAKASPSEPVHSVATETSSVAPPGDPPSLITRTVETEAAEALPRRVYLASPGPVHIKPPPDIETSNPHIPASRPPRRRRPGAAARPITTPPAVESTPAARPVKARGEPHPVKPTESEIKSKRRRKKDQKSSSKTSHRTRNILALTTASVVAAVGLGGGAAALFKERNNAPQSPKQKSIELVIPELPRKQEPSQNPPIEITETGTISQQDGGGWGHAANRVHDILDRNYSSLVGISNIVAKVGAYDSLAFSPDPDDAKPGDTFVSLNSTAIQLLDRLRQPLGPNASEDERAAVELIRRLNGANDMGTRQYVEQYGNDLVALKEHLTNILTPQSPKSYQAPIRSDRSVVDRASKDAESSKVTEKTTIFSYVADKTASLFRHDPMTKGKKAIAALAADRQRRLRQPSFLI